MKARSASQQTLMLWYLCWSLAAITLTAAHPFLHLRGTRYGYGRNIRPLECVAKGGAKGVCMFAWDCMKANGTHLGTCIDRFYFGSCCKMNNMLPDEETEAPTFVGGPSILEQPINEVDSDSEGSSETSSTNEVSVGGSAIVPGSSVGHQSTDGLVQSTITTTEDILTSTEKITSMEDQSSTNEQSSIHGETPTDNEGTSTEDQTSTNEQSSIHGETPTDNEGTSTEDQTSTSEQTSTDGGTPTGNEDTSNDVSTSNEVIVPQGASWQETTATSVISSVHTNETMEEEPGMPSTTPSESADSSPSTTEFDMAVDPKPMQPEITSPGITGESTDSGEETTSEMPGDLTTTIFNLSGSPENQQSNDIVPVTPVSAPATEIPDIGVTGEIQTEKPQGSVATITIEEIKTTTSAYTPETITFIIDTTNNIPDSGISKTTVIPSSETLTTLEQELFTEEPTQSPKPSDLLPPGIFPGSIFPVTTLEQELFTEEPTQSPKPSDLLPPGIFPGSIFPAAITQPPAITTWIPVSSNEASSIGSNMSIIFPDFDNNIVSTSKPAVDVFTIEPAPSSTGIPPIGENEVTEKIEEDSERPTVTEPMETSSESDSSESEDTDVTTTEPSMLSTDSLSLEQELLNKLNTSNYKDICGTPVYPTKRIVGGHEASYGEWPWQVSLRQWRTVTFLHKCGATLLNENWAITAAHCVENAQPDELLLRLGEFDLEKDDEPYPFAERKVQIVATHPQFEPRTFEYDLALLRFHEPVTFMPNIIPICIPQDDYSFINDTGYVTGWGRLYEDGPLHAKMQKVEVPVISNDACRQMFLASGGLVKIPRIMMCAGYAEGQRDACEGDSGGPLVIQRADGTWNLAGVISWGIGCALPNQPGVYTRISEFREWIEKIIVF
ncbi:serine proteinase stubble isoform X2 [Palaemon carinicauda]|uniref:serine proteinase stubble isoform X2 n=1 Tax=Palaemon carinicauda TaxID=392227 RepID=UPI0035B57F8E